jgi:hypothetical protein
MEKKTWQRPELVVLVHAQPEQALLIFCKTGPAGQTSPQIIGGNCFSTGSELCGLCYALSPS